MELRGFITETLKQIVDGVSDAQKYIVDKNILATIHPKRTSNKVEYIEFDVAVTSSENNTSGLSGEIKVASIFSIGGKGENSVSEQNVSRIKFRVQIELPHQKNDNYSIPSTTF